MNYNETAQNCNHSPVHISQKAACTCRYKIYCIVFLQQLCKCNPPYTKIHKRCCVSEMYGVIHYPAHFHQLHCGFAYHVIFQWLHTSSKEINKLFILRNKYQVLWQRLYLWYLTMCFFCFDYFLFCMLFIIFMQEINTLTFTL